VTAAKDAVYGVADAAGSVAEQLQGAAAKGEEMFCACLGVANHHPRSAGTVLTTLYDHQSLKCRHTSNNTGSTSSQ